MENHIRKWQENRNHNIVFFKRVVIVIYPLDTFFVTKTLHCALPASNAHSEMSSKVVNGLRNIHTTLYVYINKLIVLIVTNCISTFTHSYRLHFTP